MSTEHRLRTYDHRLIQLVQETGDATIATGIGIPRSTVAGWMKRAPQVRDDDCGEAGMNRKQKVAVVVGALVIALLALFPPWIEPGGTLRLRWFQQGEWRSRAHVDSDARDSLQLAVLVLTVASVIALRGVRVPKPSVVLEIGVSLILLLLVLLLLPVWFDASRSMFTWGFLAWWPPSPSSAIAWRTTLLIQAIVTAVAVAAVLVLREKKA